MAKNKKWAADLRETLKNEGMLSTLADGLVNYLDADDRARGEELLEHMRTSENIRLLKRPLCLSINIEKFVGGYVQGLLGKKNQVHYMTLAEPGRGGKEVTLVLNREHGKFYLSLNTHQGELWLNLPFIPKKFLLQLKESMLIKRRLDIVHQEVPGRGRIQNWPLAFSEDTIKNREWTTKRVTIPKEAWNNIFMRPYLWSFGSVTKSYWRVLSDISSHDMPESAWFNKNYDTYIDFVLFVPFLYISNRILMGLEGNYRYDKKAFEVFVKRIAEPLETIYYHVTNQKGEMYYDAFYLSVVAMIDEIEVLLKKPGGRETLAALWNLVVTSDDRYCNLVPSKKESNRLKRSIGLLFWKLERILGLKELRTPFVRAGFEFKLRADDLKYLDKDINVLKVALETYQKPVDAEESMGKIDIDVGFAWKWICVARKLLEIKNWGHISELHSKSDDPTKRYRFLARVIDIMTDTNVKKVDFYKLTRRSRAIRNLEDKHGLHKKQMAVVSAFLCKRTFNDEPDPNKWSEMRSGIWRKRVRDEGVRKAINDGKKETAFLRPLLKYLRGADSFP